METKFYFYSPNFPSLTVVEDHKRFQFINHLLIANEEDAKILMKSNHYKKLFILQGKDDVVMKLKQKYPDFPDEVLEDKRMLKYFKMEFADLRKLYKKEFNEDPVYKGLNKKDMLVRIHKELITQEENVDEKKDE